MKATIKTVVISKLFTIRHGNKFDLNKMKRAESSLEKIAFVGRSGEGNGIVAFVGLVDGVDPYKAGYITVALGGSTLSSFVQPKQFYTAQNIDVLIPRVEMTLDEKLYYCLCIKANRFRYSTFGREANRTLKDLLLPTINTIPPWVKGTAKAAIADLNRDLLSALDE